jgi:tetratricopeptide (TPR) repeat protein
LTAKPVVMRRLSLFFIIITLFTVSLHAQDLKPMQETFMEAEYFFMKGDYPDALPFYLQVYEKMPDNANIAYRIGDCYLNIDGKKNLSINYLETASKNMSAKRKEGSVSQLSAPYDALYDLGIAYLINYQFDNAKDAFTRYSGTLLPDDRENLDFVNQHIKSCDIAKEFLAHPVSFTEENLGEPFNDEKSNFNPVISADGKTFAFMVTLKFYDAVMLSRLTNGKWSIPLNITPELQSDGDMYISCLSANGNLLFLSKDDDYNSDIYFSTFSGTKWGATVKLNRNINTKYWESHGFISEDGSQLIFASDRPGGFGGLDLYVSKKINGDWGPAVNLGPEINTPFNEDRPFLINNGKTLFFSSQGHRNMGGYDLFKSELQSNNLWSKPENLGYPINTPDDNIFFMPVGNGKSGYYSVYKESGGAGKRDIYKITFK